MDKDAYTKKVSDYFSAGTNTSGGYLNNLFYTGSSDELIYYLNDFILDG